MGYVRACVRLSVTRVLACTRRGVAWCGRVRAMMGFLLSVAVVVLVVVVGWCWSWWSWVLPTNVEVVEVLVVASTAA
jgi:hypothetical protein